MWENQYLIALYQLFLLIDHVLLASTIVIAILIKIKLNTTNIITKFTNINYAITISKEFIARSKFAKSNFKHYYHLKRIYYFALILRFLN